MSDSFATRSTWAEINLDNLAFNYHSIKRFVRSEVEFMAVVKADAYGHGAVRCARRLEAEGVDWFGVALPEEGLELRANGIRQPILCLGGFWAGQENLLLENRLTPVVYQIEAAQSLNRAAESKGLIAEIHVKIDTGMGRIGVRFDQAQSFAEKLRGLKNLRVGALMTHFATADDLSENEYTAEQIAKFNRAVEIFRRAGHCPAHIDSANSPAAVAHPAAHGTMIRIGGLLYGLGDDVFPEGIVRPALKPVLSLRSRIALIKKVPKGETLGYGRTFLTERASLIATVPVGYEDGYRRALSNKAHALAGESRVPVVGRVSMDWTIFDVTDAANVQVNDEVVLIGACGGLKVTAEELAQFAGTISYEITCGISRRVRRVYVGS